MSRTAKPWYRSDRKYWMAWIDGKQIKLLEGKETKADEDRAKKELKELLRFRDMVEPDINGRRRRLTVAGVIDLYLKHAVHRYAPRTYYEREQLLQRFGDDHGWRRVNDRDCLPLHLTTWLDEHRDRWKSDWTLGSVVNIIQRPFNWAAKERLISANPFRGVAHSTGAPRRPMTDMEFEALVNVAVGDEKRKRHPSPGQRFGELLWFLRLTGMRPGEAAKLKWSDVYWDDGLIILNKHKTIRMQRKPKPRIVPLTAAIVELLKGIEGREDGELVFYNHRGTAWNRSNMSLRMQRARKESGVPDDAKLYGLRHRFGTQCIIRGVDLKTTSELLGHTTTRMTEHYLHLAGEKGHLAAAMNLASG